MTDIKPYIIFYNRGREDYRTVGPFAACPYTSRLKGYWYQGMRDEELGLSHRYENEIEIPPIGHDSKLMISEGPND